MAEKGREKKPYVWVTDSTGKEYLCPADALKDPKHASKDELDSCIDVEPFKPYLDK
ncbi:MAG: hypothetical protein HY913_03020 [Desulfomonile tiedjei]|nr:hypothetical protein [Desulfomonile tiedjei]